MIAKVNSSVGEVSRASPLLTFVSRPQEHKTGPANILLCNCPIQGMLPRDTRLAKPFADRLLWISKSMEMINVFVQHSIAQKHPSINLCREIQGEMGDRKALRLRYRNDSLSVVFMALCHGVFHVLYNED